LTLPKELVAVSCVIAGSFCLLIASAGVMPIRLSAVSAVVAHTTLVLEKDGFMKEVSRGD
jgi:hypothetical protein